MPPQIENPWILRDPACVERAKDTPPVGLRVFALPQAGCGAWQYHGWQKRLPPHAEVLPIEYPGRNSRLREPYNYESLQSLAVAIVDNIEELLPGGETNCFDKNPPYVILGWSMGAWLGYEMVCEITRRRGDSTTSQLDLPLALYAGGARAPSLAGPDNDTDRDTPSISTLPVEEFWRAFDRRYGKNPDLTSPALRQLTLPTLRKDFTLMETYVASRDTDTVIETQWDTLDTNKLLAKKLNASTLRLHIPLVAFGAIGDGRYTEAHIKRWSGVVSCENGFLYGQIATNHFRERWFNGVSPENQSEGKKYWGTPHRMALDYPDELLQFLNQEFKVL